jgi:hypothetical protein
MPAMISPRRRDPNPLTTCFARIVAIAVSDDPIARKVVASIEGVPVAVFGFAMGVDFPSSNRRFSRLANAD